MLPQDPMILFVEADTVLDCIDTSGEVCEMRIKVLDVA